jgi:hypothetical protein
MQEKVLMTISISPRFSGALLALAALIALLAALIVAFPVSASHSFTVEEVQTCLNGAVFDGFPTAASALDQDFIPKVYFEGTMIATGDAHLFTEVGEVFTFTVYYEMETVEVGDQISVSASESETSEFGSDGAGITVSVTDCVLPDGPGGTPPVQYEQNYTCSDARVNCQPYAPVTVYCSDIGVDIYGPNGVSAVTPVLRVSYETLKDTYTFNQSAAIAASESAGLTLSWTRTGELQLRVQDVESGKRYNFVWDGCP